eukprot:3940970-Rhodomonas_salina.1
MRMSVSRSYAYVGIQACCCPTRIAMLKPVLVVGMVGPGGYGRVKPDIVAYGKDVRSLSCQY